MSDEVLGKPRLLKAFAPRREWDVAISDGSAERLGEDARIVVQVGRCERGTIESVAGGKPKPVGSVVNCPVVYRVNGALRLARGIAAERAARRQFRKRQIQIA
jgi:hypothetical protein